MLSELLEPSQSGPFAPRDECSGVPGAAEFRRGLAAAVLDRDADAMAALALPEVKLGFGGDDGRERFRERLRDDNDGLMDELARLLQLGCAVNSQGGLTMPWYFAQEFGDIDAYGAALVAGENVPMLGKPDAQSTPVESLSWELVELTDGLDPAQDFTRVRLRDGRTGYLPSGILRSLLDYRLLAVREGEDWRISAILAGD
ncbi:MAG: hypothetical protein R3E09_16415 [Novosphingobium sp.]|nr:hypothetical protein [Novosphingobium sp.]